MALAAFRVAVLDVFSWPAWAQPSAHVKRWINWDHLPPDDTNVIQIG
jgi:hypothetical protein